MTAAVVVTPVTLDEIRQIHRISDQILVLVSQALTAHHTGQAQRAGELRREALRELDRLNNIVDRLHTLRPPAPRRPAFTWTLKRPAQNVLTRAGGRVTRPQKEKS